ncbi:MAG: hypothetical protein QW115_01060 [Thermoplasmata archaeon]
MIYVSCGGEEPINLRKIFECTWKKDGISGLEKREQLQVPGWQRR